MRYEFAVETPLHTQRQRRKTLSKPQKVALPKIVNTLVLAHQIRQAVDEGRARSYSEVAGQLGVTRARMSQIMGLLRLAPKVQEALLLGDAVQSAPLCERDLRPIVKEPDHARQLAMFNALVECQAAMPIQPST